MREQIGLSGNSRVFVVDTNGNRVDVTDARDWMEAMSRLISSNESTK
jgi:hypothetical protein